MAESTRSTASGRRLLLASASPRRQELLARIMSEFVVVAADVDETPVSGESPAEYVSRVASEKARAVACGHPDDVVLAADTTVVLDGQPIGKPADDAEARLTLGWLSGRTHEVLTGVAVMAPDRQPRVLVESTTVEFADLGDREIAWYVGTGEPMGKAGAYALQGAGAVFIERVEGDPANVIGLPLRRVAGLLASVGLDCPGG